MAELIDADFERGKIAHATEPRAAAARYDKQLGRMIVDLTNGCFFTPTLRNKDPWIARGLSRADRSRLASHSPLKDGRTFRTPMASDARSALGLDGEHGSGSRAVKGERPRACGQGSGV
jgi:hypothetical protein